MSTKNFRIERTRDNDYRRVETHVEEIVNGTTTERVITVMEEKVPMEVRRVVKETVVPVVTSRRIEEYKDGKVVNSAIEVVPEHALNLAPPKPVALTKEELRLALKEVVTEMGVAPKEVPTPAPKEEVPLKVTQPEEKKLSAKKILKERVESEKETGILDYVLWTILAALAAGVVYFSVIKGMIG